MPLLVALKQYVENQFKAISEYLRETRKVIGPPKPGFYTYHRTHRGHSPCCRREDPHTGIRYTGGPGLYTS